MGDATAIASSFVTHYFTAIGKSASGIASLYAPSSALTFDGVSCTGSDAIVAKYGSLGTLAHNVQTMDVQPGPTGDTLLIFVTGDLRAGANTHKFSQMFVLKSTGPGAFYVNNDVFRVTYTVVKGEGDAFKIAESFIGQYFATIASAETRKGLPALYSASSALTFEGSQCTGSEAIAAKYGSLGMALAHNVLTMDVQPGPSSDTLIIYVTGQLKIDGGNPLNFSQVFMLKSTGPGAFYIHNDIFRLIYG